MDEVAVHLDVFQEADVQGCQRCAGVTFTSCKCDCFQDICYIIQFSFVYSIRHILAVFGRDVGVVDEVWV